MTPQKGTPSRGPKTNVVAVLAETFPVTAALRSLVPRRSRARQAAFLHAFRVMPIFTRAARAACIGRRRHYHWMEKDPEYRTIFTQLRMEVHDELQDEAVRRAKDGWLEPVFHQGIQVGTRRRYSDRLLMFLLQALRPEKYG